MGWAIVSTRPQMQLASQSDHCCWMNEDVLNSIQMYKKYAHITMHGHLVSMEVPFF